MLCNPFNSESRKVYVVSYASVSGFPTTGSVDTIYIDESTNELYRWTGAGYVVIGEYPTVPTYADLPPAAANNGKIYLVTTSTGIWPFSHPAGFYISNGVTWTQIPATAGAITYADLYAVSPITYDGAGTYSTSIATNKLVGRYSASTGVMQEISLDASTLSLSGAGVLTAIAAAPSGAASGDLADFYPNPTVAKINGNLLGSTTPTNTNILLANGTSWVSTTLTGDVKINSGGITVIGANIVTDGMLRQSLGLSIIGRSASTTGDVADIVGTANQILCVNNAGTALAFGSINLASSAAVGTSILPIANGGNNIGSQTTNGVLFNNGTENTTSANLTYNSSTSLLTAPLLLLGSGNSTLRFGNGIVSRKIELYRDTDNDHQFYGFGINAGVQRYQVANSGADHIFYSGINSTTSLELLRIKGTGVINIPGLTASSVVLTDASKNLVSATVLPLANGGTNANLTASNGGIFYSTGSAAAILAGTATANQLLISGASGAPSWTSRYIDYGTANPTTSGGNLFIGTGCGKTGITLNQSNTGVGVNCFNSLSLGSSAGDSSAFGFEAGKGLTTGTGNTFLGHQSGLLVTVDSFNCFLGRNAGSARANYNSCTFVGSGADASVSGLNNAIAIGSTASVSTDNTIVLGNTSIVSVTTSGNLGLGTTLAPQFKIEVVGAIAVTDGAAAISAKQLAFSYDTVNDRSNITSIHQGTAFTPIILQCASVGIMNGTTPGTPTGEYRIYSLSGALKGKGTSGTVTNIGNADPHCKKCGSDFGLGWENPRYGGEMLVCKICETEYLNNLRKCISYIANDNKAALSDMQDFLSEDISHVVWNIERNDQYKNIRIPQEIGSQMADDIAAIEAAENAVKLAQASA